MRVSDVCMCVCVRRMLCSVSYGDPPGAGLGGGAIAGIVIGLLVFFGLLGGGLFYMKQSGRLSKGGKKKDDKKHKKDDHHHKSQPHPQAMATSGPQVCMCRVIAGCVCSLCPWSASVSGRDWLA